ncbi:glutathione S-transferase [Advenella sp. RU8]|uniref:glutathione S-transferase n=1 Tax=Advenella sp. RU8 TaxID=3399575 RepID=UPI003AADCC90
MKLYYSTTSPFVRKVMMVVQELGLLDQLEKETVQVHPVNRLQSLIVSNPLGQVPTLITDDGQALYDSRVICEYLNDKANGRLFGDQQSRWGILSELAALDGSLSALVTARYEISVRPVELQWLAWVDAQMDKTRTTLEYFEGKADTLEGRVDIAIFDLACLLGYLDFRFAHFDWRKLYPKLDAWYAQFSQRPSVKNTAPV